MEDPRTSKNTNIKFHEKHLKILHGISWNLFISQTPPKPLLLPEPLPRSTRHSSAANLRTKILDFKWFDPITILNLRGGIPRPIGDFPESLGQRISVGIIVVGRLGVRPTPFSAPCRRALALVARARRRARPSEKTVPGVHNKRDGRCSYGRFRTQ